MTIVSANLNLQIALPQGRTHEEVLDLLNDFLTEMTQGESMIIEAEVGTVHVNADPFGKQWQKNVNQFPPTIGGQGLLQPELYVVTHGVKR